MAKRIFLATVAGYVLVVALLALHNTYPSAETPHIVGKLMPLERNCNLRAIPPPKNKVFVTLYSAKSACYDLALGILLQSFRLTNSSHKFIVLYAPSITLEPDLLRIGGSAVEFVPVPLLKDLIVDPRLETMATKFQLWRLICYDAVAYYDADHIFLENIDDVFDECGASDFCAVPDPAPNGVRRGQFNAGFFIARTSASYSEELLEKYRTRDTWMTQHDLIGSGDQIFLNGVIGDNWKVLSTAYNAQHVKHSQDGKVLHYKLWKNSGHLNITAILGGSPFLTRLLEECYQEEEELKKMALRLKAKGVPGSAMRKARGEMIKSKAVS